ncbi:hypothetical protein E3N88_37557 [Mikania micrantha]|uniref:Uncharacterized protein n=1 Tax=Mikania micrantha TaxID=192012 RepID=A0A5N6LRN6_9ASTR|nr:hypothetical protein E3N88_37557 [Mikania micrantha]
MDRPSQLQLNQHFAKLNLQSLIFFPVDRYHKLSPPSGRSRREAEKQGVARAGADALEAVGMSSPIAGSCRGFVARRRGRDAGDTERGSFVRVTEW